MIRALRFTISVGFPVAALLLHGVICASFLRRWDSAAALTVFPFWFWGLLGLGAAGLSWLIFRGRFALAVSGLWFITTLVGADETRPLLRLNAPRPEPGNPAPAPDGSRVIRVITLNCKSWRHESVREVVKWNPDIVLLQEAALPGALERIARELYPGQPGNHVADGDYECAIITRGSISPVGNVVGTAPRARLCQIDFGGGLLIRAACIHLSGAATDVRLYRPDTLRLHANNRRYRRAELQPVIHRLQAEQAIYQNAAGTSLPALIGGDFNCPAGDSVFQLLERAGYTDAFATAGTGWGNTFPNRLPVLRIDQVWANSRLQPLRSIAVKSENSDHRMVVCDFAVK